jgi:cytochrome bd-type quinol oxidase subunit 2
VSIAHRLAACPVVSQLDRLAYTLWWKVIAKAKSMFLPLVGPKWARILPWAAGGVLCQGVVALIYDHLQVSQPRIFNMHLLFGVAVTALVAACLLHGRRSLAHRPQDELHSYARRVARWTYILLYVLALVRLGLDLSAGSGFHPLDDFQIYVAYCVIPMWLVRAVVLSLPALNSRVTNEPQSGDAPPEPAALPAVIRPQTTLSL